MRLKNNNIKSNSTSHFTTSRICLWLTLLFSLATFAQAEVRESVESNAEHIVIDLGIIDHLKLSNSDTEEVRIRAVNSAGVPRTELRDKGQTLYISSVFTEQIQAEPSQEDKLCSVEPVYPTFHMMIPAGKRVSVTIGKGNLYAEGFKGDLRLVIDEGLVRMKQISGEVQVDMNSGRLWFTGLHHIKVHAETSMGELVLTRKDGSKEEGDNSLDLEFGAPENLLEVRTIMGSIYLEQ